MVRIIKLAKFVILFIFKLLTLIKFELEDDIKREIELINMKRVVPAK